MEIGINLPRQDWETIRETLESADRPDLADLIDEQLREH